MKTASSLALSMLAAAAVACGPKADTANPDDAAASGVQESTEVEAADGADEAEEAAADGADEAEEGAEDASAEEAAAEE